MSMLSNRFFDSIIGFNFMFSFTSFFTTNKLEKATEKNMCYKIKGMVYHKIGTLKKHRMLQEGMIQDYLLHDNKEDKCVLYDDEDCSNL